MLMTTQKVFRYAAVVAMSVASVFASSAIASASPIAPHDVTTRFDVSGTVTALSPSTGTPTSVTIQPRDSRRPSQNVLLGASTVYYQGGTVVGVSTLAIGEPVEMSVTGTPATALVVHIEAPHRVFLSGTVTALSPSTGTPTSVTIQPRDKNTSVLSIALTGTTLYYLGGKATTAGTLVVGSHVVLQTTGTPPTATIVEIMVPRPTRINGTVTALTPSTGTPTSVTIMPEGDHAVAVSVDLSSSTVYKEANKFVTATDLVVGSKVDLLASGNPETATIVRIATPRSLDIDGLVIALSPATGTPTSMTVQPGGAFRSPVTVNLAASTSYFQLKASTTVAAVLVSSRVEVAASGNPLTATAVRISPPPADITIGDVTAVSSSAMTVQPQTIGSAPVTFSLTNATSYFAGRRSSTVNGVNLGDTVRVAANAAAPSTAVFVTVRDMALIGRVTGVAGDVISLRGIYGSPLTVSVTTSTLFKKEGHPSSLGAVVRGELIVAQGAAISGVTKSVSATNVWIGIRGNLIYRFEMLQHHFSEERHHR